MFTLPLLTISSTSITPASVIQNANNHLDCDLMHALDSLGMDDKATDEAAAFTGKPSIILEDSCDIPLRDPRHSLENHSSSRDLMAHMHGLTPISNPTRPPRLSIGSVSTQGNINKFNVASPFPQPPLSSIGCHVNCFTHEFVETPMMKPLGWGSCPVDGRDWGTSEGCDERTGQALLRMLEWACQEAGKSTSILNVFKCNIANNRAIFDHAPRFFRK